MTVSAICPDVLSYYFWGCFCRSVSPSALVNMDMSTLVYWDLDAFCVVPFNSMNDPLGFEISNHPNLKEDSGGAYHLVVIPFSFKIVYK